MYTLWRLVPRRELLLEQMPTLTSSLLIAELFYKFGSFSLEAVAFLATWFVLDAGLQSLLALRERAATPAGAALQARKER